ncbi:LPS-assembly protein LptD [Roseovarius autotrophicus]|uniref:LPS-assembly protein LptD n=1 Tax=Roseovarius autotrophicus TaxID=2824121 RepID=UPI0019F6AFFB|nr:LPS assembly protein LptD [Roseovarius autotrophicus]MBE0454085.1 LPS-assembly protein LptD [Roseovarius sp.]
MLWRLVAFAVLFLAPPLAAQERLAEPAMLVADEITMTGDERLIARGNVEALYQGRRLTAHEIVYDRAADRLTITGPLSLSEGTETVILADSAALDRDLSDGILRGARIVMHDQLQLAAHQMRRTDARLNELYKATVTSCRVCETGRPPLWQIRAERLVHDEDKNRLYFYNAQFRVLDTPVFYLPRLSLPDGSVTRATGFLTPSVVNSSLLGTGVRVPYFITLGDHRDLTIAPFYATNSRRLELRYRQAFRSGDIEVKGAVAEDDFSSKDTRGYLFATGRFDLPRDFVLRFGIEYSSDDTFLVDHDFSDKDRLQSGVSIERARRDDYARMAVDHFRSLRVDEQNSTMPSLAANAEYQRRMFPGMIGGELRLTALAHGHARRSDLSIDGPDPDTFADGRDLARFTAEAEWLRQWILPAGVVAQVQTGLALDHFELRQIGQTARPQATEVTPHAALRLRWPLQKMAPDGVAHVIEPVMQLAWSGGSNPNIPNDENTAISFDEGNLFNVSRFVAPDRRERGLSAAYGVSYARIDPTGWEGRLALGQVYREDRLREPGGMSSFTTSSGLSGQMSDLLIAGQFRNQSGLVITARGLFDDMFEVTRAEARGSWRNARTNIGATYIWMEKDVRENRDSTISEWAIDGSYRFADHWTASGEWRFDTTDQRSIRAGTGLTYTNECVDITFSVSRRFTSSTILEPETNFGLVIGLRGFSADSRDTSYTRKCRNS